MQYVRVTILERVDATSFVIRCNYCAGGGREPSYVFEDDLSIYKTDSDPCRICEGKGVLRVHCEDVPVYDAFCRGTGRAADSGGGYAFYDIGTRRASHAGRCRKCDGVGIRSLTGSLSIRK